MAAGLRVPRGRHPNLLSCKSAGWQGDFAGHVEEETVITLIFLFAGLTVVAIVAAGVYFGGARKAKATAAQRNPRDVSRATGPGDD